MSVAATTGRADPLLNVPEVPRECRALWNAYLSLAATRRSGMGLHGFALVDIEAYARLVGVSLTPWEVDTLIAIDHASRVEYGKQEQH